MPLAYRIEPKRRIVTITGDYAAAPEWREMLDRVAADPEYRHGFSFLRDLRASRHPVDAETVVRIVAVVSEVWEVMGVHRAAIVTARGVNVPASVAQALAEEVTIPLRAFTSYDDAVAWLSA